MLSPELRCLGLSGLVETRVSEAESPQRWRHRREQSVDEEPVDPAARRDLGARTGVTRSARWGEEGTHRYPPTRPRRTARGFGKRLPGSSTRRDTLRGVEAARVAGAIAASAVVVLCCSESAGFGVRACDDERGGFGPLRRQRWRGYAREIRSFL
jgi:hypothetical protein